MGQPHNPAFLPSIGVNYKSPMSFRERFINTLALIGYKFYRDYSQLPKYESMIETWSKREYFYTPRKDVLKFELYRNKSITFSKT